MKEEWTPQQKEMSELLPKMAVGDWWDCPQLTKLQARDVATAVFYMAAGKSFGIMRMGQGVRIIRMV